MKKRVGFLILNRRVLREVEGRILAYRPARGRRPNYAHALLLLRLAMEHSHYVDWPEMGWERGAWDTTLSEIFELTWIEKSATQRALLLLQKQKVIRIRYRNVSNKRHIRATDSWKPGRSSLSLKLQNYLALITPDEMKSHNENDDSRAVSSDEVEPESSKKQHVQGAVVDPGTGMPTKALGCGHGTFHPRDHEQHLSLGNDAIENGIGRLKEVWALHRPHIPFNLGDEGALATLKAIEHADQKEVAKMVILVDHQLRERPKITTPRYFVDAWLEIAGTTYQWPETR